MRSKKEIIDDLWMSADHGTRADFEAAYEAGHNAAITESVEHGWIGSQHIDDYRAAMNATENLIADSSDVQKCAARYCGLRNLAITHRSLTAEVALNQLDFIGDIDRFDADVDAMLSKFDSPKNV